jgi:Holliday junction resolvasome RuvABC endonuclease subunit
VPPRKARPKRTPKATPKPTSKRAGATHRRTGRTRKRKQKPIAFLPVGEGDERVLGLDTSSKCIGWAVFDNGQLTQHGRFVLPGKCHGEKLAALRVWLMQLLAEFRPTRLVYEAPYRGLNGTTFGVLSRYAGMVECCHFEHFLAGIPAEDAVPAKEVKRAIGAPSAKRGKLARSRKKGRAPKRLADETHTQNKLIVLNMVNERFGLGLKLEENDESDAIALTWAWHVLNRPPAEPTEE